MKAEFIKFLDNYTGDARLYKLTTPIIKEGWDEEDPPQTYKYVVVSATVVMFSGPETYIFGADKDGKVLDWCELNGSFRGGLDHTKALENAGYEVI